MNLYSIEFDKFSGSKISVFQKGKSRAKFQPGIWNNSVETTLFAMSGIMHDEPDWETTRSKD